MSDKNLHHRELDREEHWVSISDMMAGLMMIFLFIAVVYMLHIKTDKDKIEQIAVTYQEMQEDLYKDLKKEIINDLEKWNAVLDRDTLSVRFKEPEVLFERGKTEVRPAFKQILGDFFPRYLKILMPQKVISLRLCRQEDFSLQMTGFVLQRVLSFHFYQMMDQTSLWEKNKISLAPET